MPKSSSANSIPDYEQQLFIESWANLAVEQMRLYGVPASITLAQAIVESGWGTGYVARQANNYFCIKGNNGWTGPIVKANDDDVDSSSFRQYTSIEESFHDHSKFLRDNRRYRPLFGLNMYDYKGWAHGLKSAGYATKPDYAEYLIATIEKYGLYLFDYAIPANQINTLKLPFGQQEEEAVILAPEHGNSIQVIDNQTDAKDQKAEDGQAMPAPGYHLDRESVPSTPNEQPAVEVPNSSKTVKINLILPKAIPSLKRR
jgi:Mannosyl-glycoprotein endo-beta-N-acetylglucosaminidase